VSVLVVAAHPDDEILGVGGTLARHAAEGERVEILIVAEGATARDAARAPAARAAELEALKKSAREAAKILGAAPPRFAGLPDNRLDGVEMLDLIKPIEAVIAEVRPRIVYTHHGGDVNVDHRLVHQAVMTACRPLPDAPVRAVYAFETVSSTEWAGPGFGAVFRPTRFVDIGATLDQKLAALGCYAGELRAFPHPRSREAIAALARWRGASSGLAAAEAFEVLRDVVAA
jgi:LmbE family N-acetylglucosaminyl deacetylase